MDITAARIRQEDRFIETSGQRVRYRVQGDGPPLLLIHGIGAPLEFWRPLEAELGDFTTITVDAPGAGRSSVPRGRFMMRDYAAVMDDVLDAAGVDDAHVLGLSLGGMMAQALARRSPERVRTLTLANTTCGLGSVPASPRMLATIASPRRFVSPDRYEQVGALFYGTGDPALLREHMAIRRKIPTSVRGYYTQLRAAGSWSSLPWLHTLPMPALVICSTEDQAVPAINGRLLGALLRDSRVEVVEGGSHMWLLQEPQRSAELVRDFLYAA